MKKNNILSSKFQNNFFFGFVLRFQILPDDPDLFVFDEEVVVVLEALVGKTLEQGLLEVSGKPTIIS